MDIYYHWFLLIQVNLKFLNIETSTLCYWHSYVTSVVQILAHTGFSRVSQKSNAWTTEVTKWCLTHQMLIFLSKNSLKFWNFEKKTKRRRNQILDFWLKRKTPVWAKSLTPERLKLCNSVKDIKCLFYYLKIL